MTRSRFPGNVDRRRHTRRKAEAAFREIVGMPIDKPEPPTNPFDADEQRTYIDMAFAADDPRMVSQAVKEVATLRRVPCALDGNPPLEELMRALRELGFGLVVRRLEE